jgi:hypothetical protein
MKFVPITIALLMVLGCGYDRPKEGEYVSEPVFLSRDTGDIGPPVYGREIEIKGQKYIIVQCGYAISVCPSKNR